MYHGIVFQVSDFGSDFVDYVKIMKVWSLEQHIKWMKSFYDLESLKTIEKP